MTSEFDALDDRPCFRRSRRLPLRKSLLARLAVATTIVVSFANACDDPNSIAVLQFWVLLFLGAAVSATATQQARPAD